MTPRQRELARHALGLPNQAARSYRNRFYVGPWSPDFAEWSALVDAGEAKAEASVRFDPVGGIGLMFFRLTPTGARAALDPHEGLCLEDFPMEGARK